MILKSISFTIPIKYFNWVNFYFNKVDCKKCFFWCGANPPWTTLCTKTLTDVSGHFTDMLSISFHAFVHILYFTGNTYDFSFSHLNVDHLPIFLNHFWQMITFHYIWWKQMLTCIVACQCVTLNSFKNSWTKLCHDVKVKGIAFIIEQN